MKLSNGSFYIVDNQEYIADFWLRLIEIKIQNCPCF